MNFLDRDEMTALAGEYVLGVLKPEEKDAFERELGRNRALAIQVAFWQDRLLEVAPSITPVEPSAGVWRRIERTLFDKPDKKELKGVWNSLLFWRISGLASLAASALLAVALLTFMWQPEGPQYIAVLKAPNEVGNWLVSINSDTVRLRPLAPVAVEAGKAIQFWTKPEGATRPTSLGLVPADRPVELPVSKLPGLGPNQLFEVTLEPQMGSLTGLPTGRILAVGKAVRL